MTTDLVPLAALFTLGLLGAGHCIGMCGGITSALGMAAGGRSRYGNAGIVLGYNLGRISSYAVAGLIAGGIGFVGSEYLALKPLLRGLAALLLILMGLYLSGWWRALVYLEQFGARLWRRIQPLSQKLMPVTGFPQALLMGAVWGWLPCGLVYSALAYATTAGSSADGALLMASFGAGTLPVMVLGGIFSFNLAAVLQKKGLRQFMGLWIIVFGLWTLWAGVIEFHGGHGDQMRGGATGEHHHG